jgi:hypothetical protein
LESYRAGKSSLDFASNLFSIITIEINPHTFLGMIKPIKRRFSLLNMHAADIWTGVETGVRVFRKLREQQFA